MNFEMVIIESNFDIDKRYIKRYLKYIKLCSVNNDKFKGFTEKHHILPKSLFPEYKKETDNLVKLTPSQHVNAHKILHKLFYNSTEMQAALWFMYNTRNKKYTKKEYNSLKEKFSKLSSNIMSSTMKGRTTYVDYSGNKYWLSVDDPIIEDLNLLPYSKNYHTYKDNEGNKFRLKADDPIIKELNLKGSSYGCKQSQETINKLKNNIVVKNTKGEILRVRTDDPRYISGELVSIHKNMTIINDNGVHRKISTEEFKNGNYEHIHKNQVNVIDVHGNVFKTLKSDVRLETGEIKIYVSEKTRKQSSENITKWNKSLKNNVKWMYIDHIEKQIILNDVEKYLQNGWKIGRINSPAKHDNCKGKITINNEVSEKMILPESLEYYLNSGWIKGRIKRAWIYKDDKVKQIYLKDLKEYLHLGWTKGRKGA